MEQKIIATTTLELTNTTIDTILNQFDLSKKPKKELGFFGTICSFIVGVCQSIKDYISPKTNLDISMDSVYNNGNHHLGQYHRLFDNGHTAQEVWAKSGELYPDNPAKRISSFLDSFAKDASTPNGMPFLPPEANKILWNFFKELGLSSKNINRILSFRILDITVLLPMILFVLPVKTNKDNAKFHASALTVLLWFMSKLHPLAWILVFIQVGKSALTCSDKESNINTIIGVLNALFGLTISSLLFCYGPWLLAIPITIVFAYLFDKYIVRHLSSFIEPLFNIIITPIKWCYKIFVINPIKWILNLF